MRDVYNLVAVGRGGVQCFDQLTVLDLFPIPRSSSILPVPFFYPDLGLQLNMTHGLAPVLRSSGLRRRLEVKGGWARQLGGLADMVGMGEVGRAVNPVPGALEGIDRADILY